MYIIGSLRKNAILSLILNCHNISKFDLIIHKEVIEILNMYIYLITPFIKFTSKKNYHTYFKKSMYNLFVFMHEHKLMEFPPSFVNNIGKVIFLTNVLYKE